MERYHLIAVILVLIIAGVLVDMGHGATKILLYQDTFPITSGASRTVNPLRNCGEIAKNYSELVVRIARHNLPSEEVNLRAYLHLPVISKQRVIGKSEQEIMTIEISSPDLGPFVDLLELELKICGKKLIARIDKLPATVVVKTYEFDTGFTLANDTLSFLNYKVVMLGADGKLMRLDGMCLGMSVLTSWFFREYVAQNKQQKRLVDFDPVFLRRAAMLVQSIHEHDKELHPKFEKRAGEDEFYKMLSEFSEGRPVIVALDTKTEDSKISSSHAVVAYKAMFDAYSNAFLIFIYDPNCHISTISDETKAFIALKFDFEKKFHDIAYYYSLDEQSKTFKDTGFDPEKVIVTAIFAPEEEKVESNLKALSGKSYADLAYEVFMRMFEYSFLGPELTPLRIVRVSLESEEYVYNADADVTNEKLGFNFKLEKTSRSQFRAVPFLFLYTSPDSIVKTKDKVNVKITVETPKDVSALKLGVVDSDSGKIRIEQVLKPKSSPDNEFRNLFEFEFPSSSGTAKNPLHFLIFPQDFLKAIKYGFIDFYYAQDSSLISRK